ncbi:MAG: outer membrane protein assembly factor BamA [Bacteroidia bacterium]
MLRKFSYIVLLFVFVLPSFIKAQVLIGGVNIEEMKFEEPQEYEIGGITISGIQYLDKNVLIMLSGLSVGEKLMIPGQKISKSIDNLWEQGLFSDIKLYATKVQGNVIFLNFQLEERPRLSKFSFKGVRKAEADELRKQLKIIRGQVVTKNVISTSTATIKKFYIDKGYLNVDVITSEIPDSTLKNNVILVFNVDKKNRVKIKNINFYGNENIQSSALRRYMKETKQARWYNIFKASKYIEDNVEKDLEKVIEKYNAKGFRDAQIIRDSVYKIDDKYVNLDIEVKEGNRFYFRNITWVGNSKHSTKELNNILGIKKGDIYNQQVLESRLFMNPNGRDITSLYMDDGYLFFQATPVEVLVENDSIDIEIRLYEGKQATINRVTVMGNTKTNDHVIMREIRTKPGQLFSRSDIIRTQRELAQLGYFDQEKLNVTPKPNPADGTVDIEYTVEERPSDQVELSGGWGANRVVGTLGVTFNNFSARNFFKKNAWRPLPAGDGQRLSVRAQTTGTWFQSYNMSFTEPWLGGKRPNSLTVSLYHSIQSNGEKRYVKNAEGARVLNEKRQGIDITGLSVGLGRRLQWPDDFFTIYQEATYQHYEINKWPAFLFNEGIANNLSYKLSISRNSIDAPIYPRKGSQTTLTLQLTPPYSFFRTDSTGNRVEDYSGYTLQERYKWVEYHKWKFTTSWFTNLAGNLVLNTRAGFGFLAMYNRSLGAAPFERFYLGGSGLTGFALDGREIIALRGYDDQSLSPAIGGTIISKYTMELRFPVSLNPNATVYLLGFTEAGNTWNRFRDYNPFAVKRSAGVGVRVFLPMFGLLGLDWGYRFDDVPTAPQMKKSQVHFTIGFNLGEL